MPEPDVARQRLTTAAAHAKVEPMGLAPPLADASVERPAPVALSPVLEQLTQIQEQASNSAAVHIGSVQVVMRAQPEAPRAPAPMAPPPPTIAAAPRNMHRNFWLSRRRYE